VATEWQTVKITTSYNAVLDADACCIGTTVENDKPAPYILSAAMANAGFYTHVPLKERYTPHPLPSYDQLQERGFISSSGEVERRYPLL